MASSAFLTHIQRICSLSVHVEVCRRTARPARFASWHRSWIAVAAMLLGMLGTADPAAANVINVTTLADKIGPIGTGGCSLPEAIYSATLQSTLDGVHGLAIDSTNPDHFITTACAAGDGDDIIVLPVRGVLQLTKIIDDAHNFMGPTATPIIFSKITIEAFGARLQWLGSGNARLFAVGPACINITVLPKQVCGTGSLTIRNAYIKGFATRGGDGRLGGGGGLGGAERFTS
jgi:hypothetical protein